MKIQAGKRYVMRYGGITAPMNRNGDNTHGYYWTDGYEFWCKNGLWNLEEDRRDIISEYIPQPEPLTFELKAGERYELDNGEVVQLRKPAHYSAVYLEAYPFECVAGCNSCCVTQAGNLVQITDGMTIGRIVRQHVPPTPIERLESLTHEFGEMTSSKCVEIRDELLAIIADLKATVKP